MANLVSTEANALLAATSGQAAYTAPTAPVKVALDTAVGTSTTAGTEVTGGSYARQNAAFAAPSGESITTSAAMTYTSMPSCTVTAVDEWDSAATPVRRWFGPLTASKVVNAGDTFSIAAGSYTKTLS